jgi:hypothetical protein
MTRRFALVLALGALLTAGDARAGSVSGGIQFSTPGFMLPPPNQTFSVALYATQFSQFTTPAIRSYSISLHFDPSLLEALSISFGDPSLGDLLEPAGLAASKTPTLGSGFATASETANAGATASALIAAQPDQFILARFNLRSLAPGSGVFTGTVITLQDENGQAITSISGPFPISFQVVPEPGTGALLGVGTLWLSAAARALRRRSAAARAMSLGDSSVSCRRLAQKATCARTPRNVPISAAFTTDSITCTSPASRNQPVTATS